MAFDLANYEPVSSRLARWLQDGQPGTHRVVTHLAQYTDERCVFRAELYIDDLLLATGWAEETRGEGHVNRTSHFENCETSALGRALANAGFAGSDYTKRPSREEMLKVERSAAPDPWPTDATQNVVPINQGGQASTKQVNFINMLCKQKGLSTEDINDIMRKLRADHNATFADLTSKEASALIKSLQA
jgi:hypothetical protein